MESVSSGMTVDSVVLERGECSLLDDLFGAFMVDCHRGKKLAGAKKMCKIQFDSPSNRVIYHLYDEILFVTE